MASAWIKSSISAWSFLSRKKFHSLISTQSPSRSGKSLDRWSRQHCPMGHVPSSSTAKRIITFRSRVGLLGGLRCSCLEVQRCLAGFSRCYSMKAQHRYAILSAFVLLLLALAIASWQRWAEVSVSHTERRHIAQDPLRKSATTDAQAATNGQSMVTTSEKDSPHSARGSGYVWGKALNEVYAANTVNSEGVRHLDLTKLAKSFRKFERPVNLEDASALTQARAEYLASVITAALDLKTSYQAQLADILQDYYTSDWRNREMGKNEKAASAHDFPIPLATNSKHSSPTRLGRNSWRSFCFRLPFQKHVTISYWRAHATDLRGHHYDNWRCDFRRRPRWRNPNGLTRSDIAATAHLA